MFKKITYLLSMVLGIFVVLKLFKGGNMTTSFKYPIKEKQYPEKEKITKEKVVHTKLNNRQKEILKLMNKRKLLLPSDIYALHPNVSTRTLRRDMTSLVESNFVKQEGTTRDTRYILNS